MNRYIEPMTDAEIVDRLAEIMVLEPDWDSYGSCATGSKTIHRAMHIALSHAPRPDTIVPVNGGGVQVEWNRARFLEVHISPDDPDACGYLLGINPEDSDTWEEGEIPDARVNELVERVTTRAVPA